MNSFYSLGAVCLGAASRILKSKFEKMAAAVVVGIGLLVGLTGDVQSACNPPLRDVCFHKGDWTTSGRVEMIVDFHVPSSKRGTTYRFSWSGLREFDNPDQWWILDEIWGTQHEIFPLFSGKNQLSHWFWFNPDRNREDDPYVYDSYGLDIWEFNQRTQRPIKWVASVWFRPGQAAADVQIDSEYYSDLSFYYCSIDYEPANYPGLKSGYDGPYWVRRTLWTAPWPIGRPY